MKHWHSIFTHAWRAKLLSLVLATFFWLFLRHSINYSPFLRPPVLPPPPVSATPMPPP